MNMTVRYRKKNEIASRNIAGESFLIPVCGTPAEMEKIFVMNPMADFIWQRLDGRQTLEAIMAAILEDFAVEPEQATADMADLIGQLLENGLIEEAA
jgi:methyltransferase-like protein